MTEPKPKERFTLDGSEQLEAHLARACSCILQQVQSIVPPKRLEGLVLAGGYGRGEGGVLRSQAGDKPYNDLEFYVFISGNRLLNERVYGPALRQLGERLTPEAGLHVEFKVDSARRMQRSPISIFTYDLISAHRILFGNAALFEGCEHHLRSETIPLSEASRLMLNRCSGLLLAQEILRSNSKRPALTCEDADFIGRNLAKAQLCLGDALLVAFGLYHWSCAERHQRLKQLTVTEPLPSLESVRAHHAAGVRFKLHPRRISKPLDDFEAERTAICELASKVWLWLENRRLGWKFNSVHDYAFHTSEKYPNAKTWRNYLLNLRTFGAKAAFKPLSWRDPRERLLNALSLLLWNGELAYPSRDVRHLQKQLATNAADWSGFVNVYKQIWPQYG